MRRDFDLIIVIYDAGLIPYESDFRILQQCAKSENWCDGNEYEAAACMYETAGLLRLLSQIIPYQAGAFRRLVLPPDLRLDMERPDSGGTSMTDNPIRLDYRQCRAVRRQDCSNYDDGNGLLLDDGEEYVCPQSISYSLICKWFRAAVLPADKGLCAALLHQGQAWPCAECGAIFVPRFNWGGNTATSAPASCAGDRKLPMYENAAGVDI